MATILEQNQNEDSTDNTIKQMSTIKFDEPLNITVILGDDEDDLEEPVNNNKNACATTNNPIENFNTLREVENTEYILKENNKESSNATDGGTLNTNTTEHRPVTNYTTATIDPLDIVSDNLINYIKLYSFYQSHYTHHDSTHKRLKYIKELYFCLCYHITIDCIFPKENEQDFLINFIWKIREKSKLNISHISLYNLLSELLQWTKQKCTENKNKMRNSENCHNESNAMDSNKQEHGKLHIEVIANEPNNNMSNISNPYSMNGGQIQNPKIDHINKDIRTDPKSKTCIFKAGKPGEDVSIHINTETLESLYNITKNKNNPEPKRKQPRKRKLPVEAQQQLLPCNNEKPFQIVGQVVRSMFFPSQEKSKKLQIKIQQQRKKNLSNMSGNRKNPNKNYIIKTDRNSKTCLFRAVKPGHNLSINMNTETIGNLENITKTKNNAELKRKRTQNRKSHEPDTRGILQKLLTSENDKSNVP